MPEKLMRWNGSQWVEVSLVRTEAVGGSGGELFKVLLFAKIEVVGAHILSRNFEEYII